MSKNTGLLIIDTQVGLVEECGNPEGALHNISTLLAGARASETPVIYVQHNGPEGDSLHPNADGWSIYPAIAPQDGEPIVQKKSPDSFHDTTLEQELARRGITHLIVAGAQTDYCVNSTVRRAVADGYDVTLASDAHFTADSETLTKEQIVASFNESLNGFGSDERRVRVKPTAEIVFEA